jgi:hypothetical protein
MASFQSVLAKFSGVPDLPQTGQSASASPFYDKAYRRRWFLSRMRRMRPSAGNGMAFLMTFPRRPVLLPFSQIFGDEPYAIVGGVATASYQPERQTQDIDILIHADSINPVREYLRNLKSEKIGDLAFPASQLALSGETWSLPDSPPLDLLWSNAEWAEEAVAQARPDSNGVRVVSLAHLVLMKIDASRGIDQGDLSRMLGLADDAALDAVRKTIARHMPDTCEDVESYIEIGRIEVGARRRSS